MSFKKSTGDLKEIPWGLSGLSNLFYDYILLLGLDLFFKLFPPGIFFRRRIPYSGILF